MNNQKTIQQLSRYLFLIPFSMLLIQSCTEELSIADFEDDFKNYEEELRIEGVLNVSNFSESVIRVDKTILVTDTSLFNGIDDNGDWESYLDLNNNNQWDDEESYTDQNENEEYDLGEPFVDTNDNSVWDKAEPLNDDIGIKAHGPDGEYEGRGNGIPDPGEPHVDDYIEVLPQIHDTTMTSVVLRVTETQEFVAEFVWSDQAGYFDEGYGPDGPPSVISENTFIRYYYGGYIPGPQYSEVTLQIGTEYSIELVTADGRIITASTTPLALPLNWDWPGTTVVNDTTVVSIENYATLSWNTPLESSFCGVIMDEVIMLDSLRGFYASLAAAYFNEDQELPYYPTNFVGIPLGLYRMILETYTNDYGNYVFSGLPIRDRELSNWRDQDGAVVLGAFGAKTPRTFYVRFIDSSG